MRSESDLDADPTRSLDPGPSSVSTPALRRGDGVGRYIVIDELGRGGMGQVVAAYDPELDRRVAIKLLRDGATTSKGRERMIREAQAMAKLAHPNVVPVFDAGTHDDGVFIAMEFIEGRTLGKWLQDHDRADWRTILDVLIKAGRGLAAAHAEGIVHRDFKPANVMVGDDGRVRVLDFGLARRFDAGSSSFSSLEPRESSGAVGVSTDSLDLSRELTEVGTVIGTPKYMASEQFFGGRVDARTDQFAFCVVAYRALFGQAPYAGETFQELGRAVADDALREPPRASRVPRRVRRAIVRGLSSRARNRFPAMEDLLTQLSGRGLRNHPVQLAAGVLLLSGAGVWWGSQSDPPCADAAGNIDALWNEDAAVHVVDAFAGTQAPFADDVSQRVVERLDAYAAGWTAAHHDACLATHVRREQSEHLMDLRMACLDGRRADLAAVVDVLREPDETVVLKAVDTVDGLRDLATCGDAGALLSAVAPPDDAATREAVDELRAELSRVRALDLAGKLSEAATLGEQLLRRANKLDYAPIVVDVENQLGTLELTLTKPDAATAHFEDAFLRATSSAHYVGQAHAILGMASVIGVQKGDPALGERHCRHARAVIERLGNPPELLAKAWTYTATIHSRNRDWDDAITALQEAIRLARQEARPSRTLVAALGNLGMIQGMAGRVAESMATLEEAANEAAARLGPGHPTALRIQLNRASSLLNAGKFDEGLAALKKLRPAAVASLGADHADIARIDHNLGGMYAGLGDYPAALQAAQRALEGKRRALGPDHPSVAFSANNVGDAYDNLGRHAEAVPYYEEALEIWGEAPDQIYALHGLARSYLGTGDNDKALARATKGLAILGESSANARERGRLMFAKARALLRTGGDRDEAISLAKQSLEAFEEDEGDVRKELSQVRAWLADPR